MQTTDHVFEDDLDEVPAVGTVVEVGRGSLPFALIHGEALVACAAWALGEARVTILALGTAWSEIVDEDVPFVLHDPLCPMTPASFVADCVRTCADTDEVVVAVGTDGEVWSPVVLPATVLRALGDLPVTDFAELVGLLDDRFVVRRVVAPAAARRVASPDDVRALEADTQPPPGAP